MTPGVGGADSLLNRLEAGQPQKIVMMGTSLTATSGSHWTGLLHAWLYERYPDLAEVVSLGVAGSASQHPSAYLSGLDSQLPAAIAENPDTVFIEFAANDAHVPYEISLAESQANLEQMIDAIELAHPTAEIILQTMSIPKPASASAATRPDLDLYYDAVRSIATARGLSLVDHEPMWTALAISDPAAFDAYVPDELHPNLAAAMDLILPGVTAHLMAESGVTPIVQPATGPQNAIELVPYAPRQTLNSNFIVGFEFEANAPILVTHLGAVDLASDGLALCCGAAQLRVGLFELSTGQRIGLVPITNSSPSEASGSGSTTYFEPLSTPILLDAGQRYVVAVDGHGESFAYEQAHITPHSLRYLGGTFMPYVLPQDPFPASWSPIDSLPDVGSYFGANLKFEPLPVTVPSASPPGMTLTILLVAAAGLRFARA